MSTRKIKNAKDLDTGELVYFKGHAQATFMSDGLNVEETISNLANSQTSSKVELLNSISEKQDTLVSGTNIKTINGESILGEGDLTVEGGAKVYNWAPELNVNDDGYTVFGTFTEDEYYSICSADILYVTVEGVRFFGNVTLGAENIIYVTATILSSDINSSMHITFILNNESGSFNGEVCNPLPTTTSQLENDSNFVSSDGLKTINGESIVGSGDITISGGSSSGGSGAYSEVNHGTADTTFTLTPNTFHVWDEVANLTLTLGSETSGVANEYLFQFNSGSEATTLSISDDIKWSEELVIEANRVYQVSILKGLASVLSWNSANTSLIENHITYNEGDFMNGGTITFEYPTASELTFVMDHYLSSTLIVPQGSTQVNIDWAEPSAPIIRRVSPTEDSTYKYIL